MKFSELNNLDFNNAASWPPLAKAIAIILIMVAVAGLGYWHSLSPSLDTLQSVRAKERPLRQEFIDKQRVMANLEAYRAQLNIMQETFTTMLRQLPTRTEMPDLLEDISNTGKKNGLTFELFKPETEQLREFYAAKPISIKARANYHQLGEFISNIALLPRIVTLQSVALSEPPEPAGHKPQADKAAEKNKALLIEATLQTYRYLEEDEIAAMEQGKDKKGRPAKP
ncbi:MAG: type 4a pilus biogenesis protein PilO [Candidatus Competibacteraceae bacterium]